MWKLSAKSLLILWLVSLLHIYPSSRPPGHLIRDSDSKVLRCPCGRRARLIPAVGLHWCWYCEHYCDEMGQNATR
jgi:hypothetical protein